MNKKLLVLILEGILCATPGWADETQPVRTGMDCKADKPEDREACIREKGKRIDAGKSLGVRPAPGMNAEKEIGTETFALSDIPERVLQPQPQEPKTVQTPTTFPLAASPVVPAPEMGNAVPGTPVQPRTEVVSVHKEIRETVDDQIAEPLFSSGGSDLTPRMVAKLTELAEKLKGRQKLELLVVGHTDPQRLSVRAAARYKDNHGLGMARARAAADYLQAALNLPGDFVKIDSKGPDMPVSSNDSLTGMAQNRRIEIVASYEVTKQVVEKVEVVVAPPAPAPAVIAEAPKPIQVEAPVVPPPLKKLLSCGEVNASRLRAASAPFRISIDGVPQDDVGVVDPDVQRCTDVSLESADLQVRYDPMKQAPVLNAHVTPNAVVRDGAAEFVAWANYAAFISKAEIRVFLPEMTTQGSPLLVMPVKLGQPIAWKPSGVKSDHVNYVLRVYGQDGKFDETRPKRLDLVDKSRPLEDVDRRERELLVGYGENSLSVHNIPVRGGAVTASGSGINTGELVTFLGLPVPVDKNGRFAAQQILPAGPHVVEVAVHNDKGIKSSYSRNLSIASEDWFYLALADLTVGRNSTTGPGKLVRADATDHFDNQIYLDGRAAFYLKGKVKGDWLLTASADTQEQPLEDLFSHFSSKDPRYLLRRLDPNLYYPVYGDDSTTVEDAPTQGKFFVRLEKGESQVMWGSFQTSITGTDLANFSRTLYGARAKLVSEETTAYGERRSRMEVFAADPGTLQSRDEFRGTGGSLYYLRNQDITSGSERLWIEIRDKDTGLVLNTRNLVPAQDYEVNSIQGRINLREGLSSTADAGTLVNTGGLSGHPVYLVATYEYAPGVTAPEDMVFGGRASSWVSDSVQLGATGYRQNSSSQRQDLKGVDATYRYKPGTYVKVEAAHSTGSGTGALASSDGGFSFSTSTSGGASADARRIEAVADLADLSKNAKGNVTYYWQEREAGFSGPGQVSGEGITQQGLIFSAPMAAATDAKIKLDSKESATQDRMTSEVDITHVFSPNWKGGFGFRGESQTTRVSNASPILSQTGARLDLVARMDFTPDVAEKADWNAYGFVQGTAKQSGALAENDRVGVGGLKRINDRLKLGGELSTGDGGAGAKLSGDWQVDDRTSFYTTYTFASDRTDTGFSGRNGLLTAGGRSRYSDTVSVFAEERLQHGSGASGLIHSFGLDLAPNDRWSHGLKMEMGRLSERTGGDTDRKSFSVTTGYHFEKTKYAGALEYRRDSTTTTTAASTSLDTWLLKNNLGYQINPDWRFLGRLNFSVSNSSQGAAFEGDYTELVAGYAWRPVANDRWNGLFKYTYLYNMPSPGQFTANVASDYSQRSHVFSADVIHDVRPWVSVGGKLGIRYGELKDSKVGGDWMGSNTWLGVLRADWHWVHEWDILTEARYLGASAARDSQAGALLGIYKHLGKHFKVGFGYNFTDYSDDLTDLSFHSHGWFLNFIGKM